MARDYDVLLDLRDQSLELMVDSGVDRSTAEDIAVKLQQHFRKHWGGSQVYFTKTKDLSERDLEIFNKYNGKNVDQLAREYDLTTVMIYRIIEGVRAQLVEKRQCKLF